MASSNQAQLQQQMMAALLLLLLLLLLLTKHGYPALSLHTLLLVLMLLPETLCAVCVLCCEPC
jgi:hypothetical protein